MVSEWQDTSLRALTRAEEQLCAEGPLTVTPWVRMLPCAQDTHRALAYSEEETGFCARMAWVG